MQVATQLDSPKRFIPPGGRAAWMVWGLAASAYVVDLAHRMSLGVAALDAEDRLAVGAGAVTILSALQIAMYVVGQIPAGLFADRIGPRRTLVIGLLTMAAGEALFALSTSFAPALLGRVLIGAGDATIFLSVLRVAAHWFPRSQFALVTALTAGLGGVGQLATTVPLTLSLDGLGWTATFASGAAFTVLLAALILVALRELPPGAPAPLAHRDRPPILAGLRSVARQPGTRQGFLTHMAMMAPFGMLGTLWGHPYLVEVIGLSRETASLVLMAGVAASVVAAPLIGLTASRHPEVRSRLAFAVGVALVIALAVLVLWPGRTPMVVLLATFAILGCGAPASMLGFDIARSGASDHDAASIAAIVNLGGWSATVALDVALAAVHAVSVSKAMLLPPLALSLLALIRLARHARGESELDGEVMGHDVEALVEVEPVRVVAGRSMAGVEVQ